MHSRGPSEVRPHREVAVARMPHSGDARSGIGHGSEPSSDRAAASATRGRIGTRWRGPQLLGSRFGQIGRIGPMGKPSCGELCLRGPTPRGCLGLGEA